jgi:hypothetical protein
LHESAHRPMEHCQRPTESCRKPTERCQRPMESCRKPTERCQRPTETCHRPTECCDRPTKSCHGPTEAYHNAALDRRATAESALGEGKETVTFDPDLRRSPCSLSGDVTYLVVPKYTRSSLLLQKNVMSTSKQTVSLPGLLLKAAADSSSFLSLATGPRGSSP